MCRAVRCKTCSKTTWAGCGQHVAQVKRQVPAGQWCTCDRTKVADKSKAADKAGTSSGGSWLASLLGRGR